MKRDKNENAHDRLGRLQGEVFEIWKQLEAFGFLLERQGDACEGTPELEGLGLALNGICKRQRRVWRDLDSADFPKG